MRITLLAAGFVIGESCQLRAVSSGNANFSAMFRACLQHKSAGTMCCLRLEPCLSS